MTMRNWIDKLDEFLKVSGRELLDHAGQISAETAKLKAEMEYDRYRALTDAQPRPVDADFEQAAKQLQKIPAEETQATQIMTKTKTGAEYIDPAVPIQGGGASVRGQ